MPSIVGKLLGTFDEFDSSRYIMIFVEEAGTDYPLQLYIPLATLDIRFLKRALQSEQDIFVDTDVNGIVKTICFIEE